MNDSSTFGRIPAHLIMDDWEETDESWPASTRQTAPPASSPPPPAPSSPSPSPGMTANLAQRRNDAIRRCTEAAQLAKRTLMFGMTTSLALQAVPIPAACALDDGVLHTVSSTKARRARPRSSSLRAHTWASLPGVGNVRINQWVHALNLFHTWAQLAAHLPLPSLIALGDAIITVTSRRAALANGRDAHAVRADFLAFIDGLPRFNGKTKCVQAAPFLTANVDSLQESEYRLMALAHGLPSPITNYEVPDMTFRSGAAMTLDMAWPEYRVAVEYDGDQHRTDKAQWRRDQEKRDRLRANGWVIFVATGTTLAEEGARDESAFAVARQLARRGAEFRFHVLEQPLERLADSSRRTRRSA